MSRKTIKDFKYFGGNEEYSPTVIVLTNDGKFMECVWDTEKECWADWEVLPALIETKPFMCKSNWVK